MKQTRTSLVSRWFMRSWPDLYLKELLKDLTPVCLHMGKQAQGNPTRKHHSSYQKFQFFINIHAVYSTSYQENNVHGKHNRFNQPQIRKMSITDTEIKAMKTNVLFLRYKAVFSDFVLRLLPVWWVLVRKLELYPDSARSFSQGCPVLIETRCVFRMWSLKS